MPTVKVLDQTGQARGTLDLSPAVFEAARCEALVHQAVVRELAGRRAGTHDTRGRSEVSGGGRKPWRQKGTGRARQGSIRATQWKGGGKPFGPTPRSHAQALPRQARRGALRAALSDKLASGGLTVVDGLAVPEAKTGALVRLLAGLGVRGESTLVVVRDLPETLQRAGRNVPWLEMVRPDQVSVARVLGHARVIVDRGAIAVLEEALTP